MEEITRDMGKYSYEHSQLGEDFFHNRLRTLRQSAEERLQQIDRRIAAHDIVLGRKSGESRRKSGER